MNLAVDLDGTLITCEPRQSACLGAIAAAQGLELDLDEVWRLKRKGQSTGSALSTLGYSERISVSVAERWCCEIEEPYWLTLDRVWSGSYKALSRLASNGCQISLVTARKRADLLLLEIRQLRLSSFFKDVHIVDVAEPRAAKAAILARGGFDAFVGDTESDFAAAEIAGVPFHAVASGQRDGTFLKQVGVGRVEPDFAGAVAAILLANEAENHSQDPLPSRSPS